MTELVRQDSYATATLTEKREYVSAIAQAGELLPKALWDTPKPDGQGGMIPARPSPAKVLMLAETGSMLGLHPMAALTGIHIIEGKPSLSANLLGALVRRAGHKLRVTTTGDWSEGTFVARAVLIRSDDPDFEFTVEWTRARAKQAGLDGKGNWSKYPEAMAKARAITEVIREGAPDVTMAAAYTPEELGAQVDGENGEPVEMPATREPKPQAPIQEPKPAAKPRAARKPKAAESETAAADAEAKARVKANQEARAATEAAEAEASGPVHVDSNGDVHDGSDIEADAVTGEVIDANPNPEEAAAYQRAHEEATNPDNIEDAQLVEDANQTDWEALLIEAADVNQMKKIWVDARAEGALGMNISWDGEVRILGEVITELGQKFAAIAAEQGE